MSGAGKTTVCKCFSEAGYDVIDCDISAREVVSVGMNSLDELKLELSPDIIKSDGTLDRRLTGDIIFNNDEKRAIFNRIIYPYITYNVIMKIKASGKCILLDAPTLYEARLEGICDRIVSVCADTEICIDRIMKRDSITRAQASARLGSQHDIEWYRERSDHCIINNGSKEQLSASANNIIMQLKGNR